MTDNVEDLKASESVAFLALEELHKDGSINKMELDVYRSKYTKLHEFVLQTYENEQSYLVRAKHLGQKLMAEKVKLEKTLLVSQEDQTQIEQLGARIQEVQNEYETVQDREMMLQLQIAELDHDRVEKETQFEEKEKERQAELEPKLQRERDEIDFLQREIELLRGQKEGSQTKLEEQNERIRLVEQDTEQSMTVFKGLEQEYNKIKLDPDRIRKQAEKFESAVKALQDAHRDKKADIEAAHETLRKTAVKQKETEDLRSKATLRLQMITESSKITDQSCDDVKKRLDREKNIYKELVMKRVSLDQELDELNSELRASVGDLAQMQKQFDKIKRQYKKTQMHKDAVDETLGPLQTQKKDMLKQVALSKSEIERQKILLNDIQGEVDLFIGAYLKQETLEKDKKEQYDAVTKQMVDMQKELANLKAEEQEWSAEFKNLASHREKLARDASTAHRLCRETTDEVAMKKLEEDDLKKKEQEVSQKEREFRTMYEVVKNERNKYMTQVQKSSQQLSEMKEKLKILQNEVEILRMESAFKDKKLQSTRQEAQRLEVVHDQLQNEKTRIISRGGALNEQVEQYVIEIDKLNSIINSIEKEMVILRRKYEQAVETRNFTGTQLIDRNDELCILWEKSNIQEKLLKKGEDAMMMKAEEVRGLKLDLEEVNRQLHVVQKQIPEVPKLVDEVVNLRERVKNCRTRTDELSRELENPSSAMRKWRKLGGEDFDADALRRKIQDLEERLHNKKESLLEKELILEEVTALSEKLRAQALDGRQGTMELSQKVNTFQARIKDVTRKMMATVSELSMYQATAIKLTQDRDESRDRTMIARERMKANQAPTDMADAEFEKFLQVTQQKELDKQAAAQRKQEEEIMNSNYTRTTAEPRVNAYIPEDDKGLPKAYGSNAPFKPTVGGSTMRHIRKPNPKPIEI